MARFFSGRRRVLAGGPAGAPAEEHLQSTPTEHTLTPGAPRHSHAFPAGAHAPLHSSHHTDAYFFPQNRRRDSWTSFRRLIGRYSQQQAGAWCTLGGDTDLKSATRPDTQGSSSHPSPPTLLGVTPAPRNPASTGTTGALVWLRARHAATAKPSSASLFPTTPVTATPIFSRNGVGVASHHRPSGFNGHQQAGASARAFGTGTDSRHPLGSTARLGQPRSPSVLGSTHRRYLANLHIRTLGGHQHVACQRLPRLNTAVLTSHTGSYSTSPHHAADRRCEDPRTRSVNVADVIKPLSL